MSFAHYKVSFANIGIVCDMSKFLRPIVGNSLERKGASDNPYG
jgi:hypothetical protein